MSTVSSNVPFNPTYSTGALDSNSLVQDTLSLTNNAPLPSNLQIINTQVIGVGGFYVRTNTLTYTANGVNIQSGGPSN